MYRKKISVSEAPHVEITSCQGDLQVRGGDDSEVLIKVDSQEKLTVEEREGAVALIATSDCTLALPSGASLTLVQLQGDLSVQEVNGVIEANSIQGDATIQQVSGSVELGTVSGDLSATEIDGPLAARSVTGDADLRQLKGPLSLNNVSADVFGRAWTAGAEAAQINGDVSLKTVFAGPFTYNIQARGDIVVRALPGSDAAFILQSDGGRVKAKGLGGEMTEEGQWQGALGEGQAQVRLHSTHGSVMLKAVSEEKEMPEYTSFAPAADFAQTGIAAEELAWRIQQRVAEKLSKIDFESIARREAERASKRAEQEAARARRTAAKARRKAENARRKAHRKVQWHLEMDTGRGARKQRRSQSVSEEERVAILRMLAENKISAQEAEILLQALES